MSAQNASATMAKNQGGEVAENRRPRRAVYDGQIGLRLPSTVLAALDRASLLKQCSTAEYIRRQLVDGLARDGVPIAQSGATP